MKRKHLLLFDSNTLDYICAIPYTKDMEPVGDTISLCETFNPDTHIWEGNYYNGKIVKKTKKRQIVKEEEIDAKCKRQINKAYPIEKQIEIIIDMLQRTNIPKTRKFERMLYYLKETNKQSKVYKKTAEKSDRFLYQTKQQSYNIVDNINDKGGWERKGIHDIDKPFEMKDLFDEDL